jgi:hypothetical protein
MSRTLELTIRRSAQKWTVTTGNSTMTFVDMALPQVFKLVMEIISITSGRRHGEPLPL